MPGPPTGLHGGMLPACIHLTPHTTSQVLVPAETCLGCHRGFMRGIHGSLRQGLLLLPGFIHSLHGCSRRQRVVGLARRVGHGRGRRRRLSGPSPACPCQQRPLSREKLFWRLLYGLPSQAHKSSQLECEPCACHLGVVAEAAAAHKRRPLCASLHACKGTALFNSRGLRVHSLSFGEHVCAWLTDAQSPTSMPTLQRGWVPAEAHPACSQWLWRPQACHGVRASQAADTGRRQTQLHLPRTHAVQKRLAVEHRLLLRCWPASGGTWRPHGHEANLLHNQQLLLPGCLILPAAAGKPLLSCWRSHHGAVCVNFLPGCARVLPVMPTIQNVKSKP